MITGIVFSPDNSLLAVNSYEWFYLIETKDWTQLRKERIDNHETNLAWSPNSKLLAGGLYDSQTVHFRNRSGDVIQSWETEYVSEPVAWHPEGKYLSVANGSNLVEFRTIEGEILENLEFYDLIYGIYWLHYEEIFTIIYTEGSDISFYDLDLNLVYFFSGHKKNEEFIHIAISPDDKFFVSVSEKRLFTWDIEERQRVKNGAFGSDIPPTWFPSGDEFLIFNYKTKNFEIRNPNLDLLHKFADIPVAEAFDLSPSGNFYDDLISFQVLK